MKYIVMIAACVAMTACTFDSKPLGDTTGDAAADSTVVITRHDTINADQLPAQAAGTWAPTGNMERDAEYVVVNSLRVTRDLMDGNATQEQQNAASQLMVDAIKYYQSLSAEDGKRFQALVSEKLVAHADEFKSK